MRTVDSARYRWRGVLSRYIDGKYLTGRHTACPMCGGKDRFRFTDHQGLGIWICNQCQPKGGGPIDLILGCTGESFKTIAAEIDKMIGNIDPVQREERDWAGFLDEQSRGVQRGIDGTPVRKYLDGRGLYGVPDNIAYHPEFRYEKGGMVPAMVARVTDTDGNRCAFHVTPLNKHGTKIGKRKVFGRLPPGAGVVLGSGTKLVIGEGIETTMAASEIFSEAGCVATLSAGGMERFVVPEGVTDVIICGDNDSSYTGQKAAYILANRLYKRVRVTVHIPKARDTDYADWL